MNLDPQRDGLQTLLGFKVSNSLGECGDYYGFFDTGNVEDLGRLNLQFYR